MQHSPIALIVAGPTCSGKSALAFSLAQRLGGTIINADSMQVYRDLRVLTARPSEDDESAIPHRLYGALDAAENGNVAWWRREALTALGAVLSHGRLPIFCGGTGMYLRALVDGLVEVPDPGVQARDEARRKLAVEGAPALHLALQTIDPEGVARIAPADGQRLARLWEVWRGTGRTLTWWRQNGFLPAASCQFIAIKLDPPRADLRAAIAKRCDVMMQQGALDEVRALQARQIDRSLPVMRAHGVPELLACLEGRVTRQEAREKIIQVTGQYTRRQATWFRHHRLADETCTSNISHIFGSDTQHSETSLENLEIFIRERLTRT